MAQARGIATKIQVWNEAVYGVTPATPVGENLYFRTNNVSGAIARAMDETISGRRGMPPSIPTQRDVQGQVVQTLAPQSCIKMFSHAFGAPTITGATGHTFVFGPNGLALPAGFGMEFDYGAAIATPGRFLVFRGCRVSKANLKFSPTGFIDATYDIRGSTFDATGTTSLDTTPDDFGHTGFSMAAATLTEGGTPFGDASDLSIDFDNDLDDSLWTIGGGGVRGDLPEGFFKVSGTLTALFKSAVQLNKALSNTEAALVLSLTNGTGDGTAGNDALSINIPNLYYEVKTPPVSGPKGLKVELAFSGHRPGAAEIGVTATVKTLRATA